MAEWPKISIITPSYNQAGFLERTIRSVIDQSYPNLEYIIIDGGSTDGSVEIIKKYADKLAYWVSEKDNGQTHALNKGFHFATGDIVAWLNSDDEYCPGSLEAVARVFIDSPNLDFVFGNELVIDETGKTIRSYYYTRFNFSVLIIHGMVLSQQSSFWKRSLFERFGYLDESKCFCMDYEFFCRIGSHIKTKHIRQCLSRFRHHKDSKTTNIWDVRTEEHIGIMKKYLKEACHGYPVWTVYLYLFLYRSFWYFIQGDAIYVLRGFLRRMLPKGLRPRGL